MKNGDVVYFKEAKEDLARKGKRVQFRGHAFGVLLGHVGPFQKAPPPEHLLRLMGQIGFISFDDIGLFLGDELAEKVVKSFEDRYYGKEAQIEAAKSLPEDSDTTEESTLPEPTKLLVDLSGAPLNPKGPEIEL